MTHVPKGQFVSGERRAIGFAGGDGELIDGARIARRAFLENAALSFEVWIRRMSEVEIGQPVAGAAATGFQFSLVTVACAVVNAERIEVPVREQVGFVAE